MSLYVGELLRSLSRTVLLQSSMASLMAVRTIITIKGTASSAGFEAPKMVKIYDKSCKQRSKLNSRGLTYAEDNDEKEVDHGNIMKLEPQILRYETQWSIFGGPYLVPRVMLFDTSLFVFCFVWKGYVHIDHPRFGLRARILSGRPIGRGAQFGVV
jgi:sRNA-binding carbon storage regulator CsrA